MNNTEEMVQLSIFDQNQEVPENRGKLGIFKKANVLITSKSNESLLAMKLSSIGLKNIRLYKDEPYAVVSAKEIMDRTGKTYSEMYSQIKKATLKMMDSKIIMEDPERKQFEITNMIRQTQYANGTIKILFEKKLLPILMGLKNDYTLLDLDIMFNFSSPLTFKFYQNAKSKCYDKFEIKPNGDHKRYRFEENLAELKCDFGALDYNDTEIQAAFSKAKSPDYDAIYEKAKKKKYVEWRDFKRNALDIAVKEVNETSDITVEYTPIKSGKGGKITAICFTIEEKGQYLEPDNRVYAKEEEASKKIEKVAAMLEPYGIDITDSMTILEEAKYNVADVRRLLTKVGDRLREMDNPAGYLITALKNNNEKNERVKKAAEKKKQGSKNEFNNFEQRTYDYDELEKQLLNRSMNKVKKAE